MFKPGNQFGRGRPKISLNKPELLLPIIFQKAHINWANDFTLLYKMWKQKTLSKEDEGRFKLFLELMPYLCTKVNIKELDSSKFTTESDKKAMTDQTKSLLEALEGMQPGVGRKDTNANPKSGRTGQKAGLDNGTPQIPPTA